MLRPPLLHLQSSVGSHHSRPRSNCGKSSEEGDRESRIFFEERLGSWRRLQMRFLLQGGTEHHVKILRRQGTPIFRIHHLHHSDTTTPTTTTINTSFSLFCCIMTALIIMDIKKYTPLSYKLFILLLTIRYDGLSGLAYNRQHNRRKAENTDRYPVLSVI